MSNFKDFKRTLLEWRAIFLGKNPKACVNSYIAIHPYYPEPYERWTGMLDLENELKVAEEFWDFLGGKGAYEALLGCLERVGREMKETIIFKNFSERTPPKNSVNHRTRDCYDRITLMTENQRKNVSPSKPSRAFARRVA